LLLLLFALQHEVLRKCDVIRVFPERMNGLSRTGLKRQGVRCSAKTWIESWKSRIDLVLINKHSCIIYWYQLLMCLFSFLSFFLSFFLACIAFQSVFKCCNFVVCVCVKNFYRKVNNSWKMGKDVCFLKGRIVLVKSAFTKAVYACDALQYIAMRCDALRLAMHCVLEVQALARLD